MPCLRGDVRYLPYGTQLFQRLKSLQIRVSVLKEKRRFAWWNDTFLFRSSIGQCWRVFQKCKRLMKPKKNPYTIEVLRRAFDVLAVFGHAKPALSLAEIVAAVKLPKTTVFRVLSSLVERGYCEFDPHTGKYGLGFELLRLADIRRRQGNMHDIAMPVMREIRDAVNETVILSVRAGDSRVHIDFVEGLHTMRRMADLGVPAPLYAGAASKVLLAGIADNEIEAYLARTDLTAFQDTTITDPAVLWREVRTIRKRGFAESKGELFPGGGALAAPIKDFSGATVAVMDILTPEHRYTAEHRDRCIDILLAGARRASERLGYRAGTAPPASGGARPPVRRPASRSGG